MNSAKCFPMGLIVALVVISLAGCNSSPPTLALEAASAVSAVKSRENPKSVADKTESVKTGSPPVAELPAESVENSRSNDPVSATSDEPLPKLAHVDVRQLVGRWRDSFFGERTLTLNADGTGRMELDLDFAGRLLYGKRLDFEMTWKVMGGVVSIEIQEGHPSDAAKSAIESWGKSHKYLLDTVEDDHVAMRDSTGKLNYRLSRLADE